MLKGLLKGNWNKNTQISNWSQNKISDKAIILDHILKDKANIYTCVKIVQSWLQWQ